MSFNIEQLLNQADPILAVRQTTTVDTTSLIQLIRRMGEHIEAQAGELSRQRNELDALRAEVGSLRQQGDEYGRLRKDVAGLIEDVEQITMYAKLPKVPNRARDGLMKSYLEGLRNGNPVTYNGTVQGTGNNDLVHRSVSETRRAPVPVTDFTSPRSPVPKVPPPQAVTAPGSQLDFREGSLPRNPAPNGVPPPSTSPAADLTRRPRTGLTMEADPDNRSLRVTAVKEGSAADEAGMMAGDIILMANHHQTATTADFIAVLDDKRPGDALLLHYQRNGSLKAAELILKSKPAPYSEDQ